MPPKPVKTRWTSWLRTVRIHSENYEKYVNLFNAIREEKTNSSSSFKNFCRTVFDENDSKELKAELDFITSVSNCIINQIVNTEEMTASVHEIYNKAISLENFFNGVILAIQQDPDINCSEKFISNSINAMKSAKEKL